MMQALLIKGMRQRADNVILSDKRSEVFGAPFTSENLVGHRRILSGSDHGIVVADTIAAKSLWQSILGETRIAGREREYDAARGANARYTKEKNAHRKRRPTDKGVTQHPEKATIQPINQHDNDIAQMRFV